MTKPYTAFKKGLWMNEINVRDFIINNYKEYKGDESFLVEATNKTNIIMKKVNKLLKKELKSGILDVELKTFSGINEFEPGFIDKKNEVIVGLQTDKPLKRIINPFGGMRVAEKALTSYNYKMNEELKEQFNKYRKTHNDGVYSAYTSEMRQARRTGLLTGLPDAYGRGRIIGDYRRIALYGIDYLKEEKKKDLINLSGTMTDDLIRLREEVYEQIKALDEIKEMAASYGFDISKPAINAKECIQFLYFGYLSAVKENNGAAMSLGRTSTFIDIYINRDLKKKLITEEEAQELVDQFIIKLRLVRHLRPPEYNELFAGDPTWVTESIGGMSDEGKSLVTKTSFRFLHSLRNLGPAPEPNLTILWSKELPIKFKKYAAKISIDTDSIQYESDELMRPMHGDDYAISCCVSPMKVGGEMQFFGARTNLGKALLLAINEGKDEIKGTTMFEGIKPIKTKYLTYSKVLANYEIVIEELAKLYVDTMNIIHYMHDKYAYERGQMALHDTKIKQNMAFGIAGLSVVVDSLSAIKYAKVLPIRNEDGITTAFEINGEFPKFGNDDDRVDDIAKMVTRNFISEIKKHKIYKDAHPTVSILTITSNVVYGLKTGSTPCGRLKGQPFAPGANPLHGRDLSGALASLNSVAKIEFENVCEDGISNTFSITPSALGEEKERINNLVDILDGYFIKGGYHLNVNVLNRELLIDAMNNPGKYPLLTIRVSGYAVRFNRLNKLQQQEVINRTFHEKR